MEKSDQFCKTVFGYDYVHFLEQIPEMKKFMHELSVKEKEREEADMQKNNKIVDYD